MEVHEVMTRPAITVGPDTPTSVAASLLLHRMIAALPVVDSGGALVGMVDTNVLLNRRLDRSRPADTVGELMSSPTVSVSSHAATEDAAELLLRSGARILSVVDDSGVVGVIARGDLLQSLVLQDHDDDASHTSTRGRRERLRSAGRPLAYSWQCGQETAGTVLPAAWSSPSR